LGTFFLVEHTMKLAHYVKLVEIFLVDFSEEKVTQEIGKRKGCETGDNTDPENLNWALSKGSG
jgi:hypothetical protein